MTFKQLELFEEWKAIPGYEGFYLASSFGRIMSLPRLKSVGGLLAPELTRDGYLLVTLNKNGRRAFQVHQLIALAFLGPVPEGKQVDHIDSDPKNNTLKNLRYVTATENVRKSRATKLTQRDVLEIRRLSQEGFKQRELADQFRVSNQHISRILSAQNWKETK